MRVSRLLAVAAVCLIVGGVVLADGRTEVVKFPPVFSTETITTCPGGFDAVESFYFELKSMVQKDKNGNVVKIMEHWSTGGRTTYFNSLNPEVAFTGGPEQPVFKLDLVSGKFTLSGMNYKVTVPGGGMIFHQGGHYVYDPATDILTHVGGPNDLWSGDFDALCEALTP